MKKWVEKRARATLAKATWERQLPEEARVDGGEGVARATILEPGIEGEVVLVRTGTAFVRFLSKGKAVQQGEVTSLAPLRLRATVNWQKDVPEKLWAEVPTRKLFSLVAKAIEAAAEQALKRALEERPKDPVLLGHVQDLLLRWARAGKKFPKLPVWLSDVQLFPTLDGVRLSLAGLESMPLWRYTQRPSEQGLLSRERVLLLDDDQKAILSAFGGTKSGTKLTDVTNLIARDREIRRRLAGARTKPVLPHMAAVVPIEGEGFKGEVGVPVTRDSQLTLRLLKDGLPIETTTLTALYGVAHAVVDCPDFDVDGTWEKVERNKKFETALRAVRTAEPTLVDWLLKQDKPLDALPAGASVFLCAFISKEIDLKQSGPQLPQAKELLAAKLFTTSKGRLTLGEVKLEVEAQGALYLRGPKDTVDAEGLFVVLASDEVSELLATKFGRVPERPDQAIAERKLLSAFLKKPEREAVLEPSERPSCKVKSPGVRGELGLAESAERAANLELLVQKRVWREERVASTLPLIGRVEVDGVNPLSSVLSAEAMQKLALAVRDGEDRLVKDAMEQPNAPHARRMLLAAIAERFDERAPGKALWELELFACTDGRTRSAKALEDAGPVKFVTRALQGSPASGVPVVVAESRDVRMALIRFPGREDITEKLARELDARAARARIAPKERIVCEGEVLARRPFQGDGMEGEVAIALSHPRRLELFTERKPLATLEGELPAALCAAVNFDALQPGADGTGAQRDKAFRAVIDRVLTEADALAVEQARHFSAVPPLAQERLRLPLLQLAVWGQKREAGAALAALPLLETTTGQPLTLAKLIGTRKGQQSVRYSSSRLAPLDEDRWVWCPRPYELEIIEPLRLKLTDYSDELLHAEKVRSRPRESTLKVEGPRAWVEPVTGKQSEGEVALRERAEPNLTVDVLRERVHLELWTSKHPIGAVAKVNCDALTPTAAWKRAVRNRAFKTMVEDVEAALERLLARRLSEGPRDAEHRQYALAALGWQRPHDGPLSKVLPTLALFKDTGGKPVTLGAVLEEHARARRIAVARPGLAPSEGLVLTDDEATRATLVKLKLELEDVSPILARAQALEESRRARRLSRLSVAGEVLVRVAIDRDGVRGELALPLSPDKSPVVTLAKDGIAVSSYEVEGRLPVAGVIDSPSLIVNSDWTSATPDGKLKALIADGVEQLYAALAVQAERSPTDELRRDVRFFALQFIALRGMAHASGLERLVGAAQALARIPLFRTTGGERLSLAVLAAHVGAGDKVGVMPRRLMRPDVGGALVLEAETLVEPWIDELKSLLGPSSVERIDSLSLWKRERAEADPQSGTPLLKGLLRLRKQLKLLRSGALGRLTPDELDDVRLSKAKLKRRVEYDAGRKLLLLDGNDAQVVRTLEEAAQRPERLYVLLAACYGEVNRVLHHVTDAHEADLLAALALHLASNPAHLSGNAPEAEKEAT